MKKRNVFFLAIASSFILLSPQANAYKIGGDIYEINRKFITVGDIQLPLSPTVTVTRADESPELLLNLKPGDGVTIETRFRNKRYYVKRIQLKESSKP